MRQVYQLVEDAEKFSKNFKLATDLNPTTEDLIRWALKVGYVTGVTDEIEASNKWQREHLKLDKEEFVKRYMS